LELYRDDAAKILANVCCRSAIQTDISVEYENTIEVLSEKELFRNSKETVKLQAAIAKGIEELNKSIEKIKEIERST